MASPRIIYIAGPMRGIPAHNEPAFKAAEQQLIDAGWAVVNPVYFFLNQLGIPQHAYMRVCCAAVKACDAIYLLRGWEESEGASTERAIAAHHGLEYIYESTYTF
jgi:hypothetical protein